MSARHHARSAILVVVGVIGLVSLMGRPRFQTYHTVDVLQLIVSGMCFGVALAGFFGRRMTDGR